MKKKSTFLFLFLILSFQCSFAQNGWKNATKTADSLDLEKQFEASLPFRIKAVETAKNAPGSIQKTLLGLKRFTQAEHDFSTSSNANPDAYALMQSVVDTFISENARPERIYKRSEEHTSELQSLMRISSAVFCS